MQTGRNLMRGALLLFTAALAANAYAQDTRTVVEPTFPASCSVVPAQLGLVAGEPASETAFDTVRIQAALNACPAGQAVELQASGTNNAFLVQPITIPTGVTLVVDGGATVFGSRNPADYQVTGGETCGTVGSSGNGCKPLIDINGNSASTGAGIMGYGVIDGRGEDTLLVNGTATANSWWDIANQAQVAKGSQNNPILLTASKASNFTLYKITLRNSPMFHVKWQGADGFTAWGVKIATPYTARNSDGIDPSGSDITVTQSSISDGDDNVALSASSATSNITISNDNTYSGHGISIGSFTKGGLSNMLVTNINQVGTAADKNGIALRIKSSADRGGLVQNVAYQNICMQNHARLIDLDPFYNANAGTLIPQFSNISFTNIHGLTDGKLSIVGYDTNHVTTVALNNVVFDALSASNLSPAFQFDSITLGPGPVLPTFLQSQTGKGVSYSGNVSSPSTPPYPCSAASFRYLVGEFYLSSGATVNGQQLNNVEGPATITLNAVLAPAMSQVTFGAYTGVPAPTATVQFLEGSKVVGTANLTGNGTLASLTLAGVALGSHTYIANYPGDANYAAYSLGAATVTVVPTPSASSTTLNASASTLQAGSSVSLVATVKGAPLAPAPTGTINFFDGTTLLGTSTLSGSSTTTATLNAVLNGPGAHSVTAVYSGDAQNAPSTSTAVGLQVTAIPTMTAVSLSSAAVAAGASATVTATVTSAAAVPAGTVTFYNGTTALGMATLTNGVATVTTTSSTVGSQSLSATYAANGNFAGSTSPAVTLSFTGPFTLSADQYALTLSPGGSGTVNVTATPAIGFAGAIAFSCLSPVAYLTCSMGPASQIVGGGAPVKSALTVTLAPTVSSINTAPMESHGHRTGTAFAFLLPLGALLFAGLPRRRLRLLNARLFLIVACAGALFCINGCGSTSSAPKTPPAGTQVVTVTATSGSATQTLSVAVDVT